MVFHAKQTVTSEKSHLRRSSPRYEIDKEDQERQHLLSNVREPLPGRGCGAEPWELPLRRDLSWGPRGRGLPLLRQEKRFTASAS